SAGSEAGSSSWFVIRATPGASSSRTPPSRPSVSRASSLEVAVPSAALIGGAFENGLVNYTALRGLASDGRRPRTSNNRQGRNVVSHYVGQGLFLAARQGVPAADRTN